MDRYREGLLTPRQTLRLFELPEDEFARMVGIPESRSPVPR